MHAKSLIITFWVGTWWQTIQITSCLKLFSKNVDNSSETPAKDVTAAAETQFIGNLQTWQENVYSRYAFKGCTFPKARSTGQ